MKKLVDFIKVMVVILFSYFISTGAEIKLSNIDRLSVIPSIPDPFDLRDLIVVPPLDVKPEEIVQPQPEEIVQPQPVIVQPQPVIVQPSTDRYNFGAYINSYRNSLGLRSLAYDPSLDYWSHENNKVQNRRGLGHYVMGPSRGQNAGWNYPTVADIFRGWRHSPGHNRIMKGNFSTYGIWYGPGPYWTLCVK